MTYTPHTHLKHLLQVSDVRALLTGLLLLTTLIVFSTTGIAYLTQRRVLERSFIVHAVFPDGSGLARGAKVLLAGVEVGSIQNVTIDAGRRVVVTMKIRNEYRDLLREDAVCYPFRDRNLVSDRVINIEPGDPARPMLGENDTLATQPPRDIESVLLSLTALSDRVMLTLDRVDTLLAMAVDTTSTMGAFLRKDDVYQLSLSTLRNAERAAIKGKATLDHSRLAAEQLNRQLPELLARADSLSLDLFRLGRRSDTIFVDLQAAARDARTSLEQAADLLEDGEALLGRSDRLVRGLQSHWFLRGSMPEDPPPPAAAPALPVAP